MIKMRNNWDEGRLNPLQQGNSPLSKSQHDGKDSFYDFGISTDRSISAPPPSGMGFGMLSGLEDSSGSTWGDGSGSYSKSHHDDFKGLNFNAMRSSDDVTLSTSSTYKSGGTNSFAFDNSAVNHPVLDRPKSAAPSPDRNHLSLFLDSHHRERLNDSSSDSLFRDFDIMKIGERRSASTGVIGHGPSSSSAVMESLGLSSRDNKKTFMDLIQEDMPPKVPTPEYDQIKKAPEVRKDSLDSGNSSHHSHGIPHGMHSAQSIGSNNSFSQNHRVERMPENQMNSQAALHQMEGHHIPEHAHMNNVMPPPHVRHPGTVHHTQQNGYDHPASVPYYNLHQNVHQRDSVPLHTQPAMHPQVIHGNGNAAPAVYYGGYAAMQFHQPPAQHFPPGLNPQVIHAHDPNMASRMPQPQQILTAMPIQGGIPAHINGVPPGTFIYFHQPGAAIQASMPAPRHPQPMNIVDASGRPVQISPAPSTAQNIGRKQMKSSPVGGKGIEKSGRKSRNNGKRGNSSSSSLDASRHSFSSATLSLLEEYRSSKDRAWTASDVKGHIVEFCQDQNGSRFIQQRLEVAKEVEIVSIATEVLPAVHTLRNDVFGNYVVQKLFEHGNHDIRSMLKKTLKGCMLNLSSQMYGCRVVQKALEKVNDSDLIDLLSEFHGSALSCIHDQNGNHVLQKIIEVVSNRSKIYQAEDKEMAVQFSQQLQFILDCVMENIVSLSCHPFGCRVLQRILEHCVESQKSLTLDAIQGCLRTLLDDQYGNYVIQHVLQFGRKSDRDVVLQIISENGILGLSRQKFASNVIEKLLKYGNSDHRNAIIREMLKVVHDKTVDNGRCSIALLMVRDAYANYVVQTTLDVAPEGEDKQLLLQELRSNSAQLRNYTFAKHIITKIEEAEGHSRRLG